MMGHPLVLSVLLLDLLSLMLLGYAAWVGGRVVLSWQPASSDAGQLRLERRYEAAALSGRLSGGLFLMSFVLYIVAIAAFLPGVIPGAMCGVGVMQAMGVIGRRSIWVRLGALVMLHLATLGFSLDREKASAPLALLNAKLSLMTLPVLALAVADTFRAFLSLDTTQPVSCCTAMLDTVNQGDGAIATSLSDNLLTAVSAGAGVTLFVLAIGLALDRFDRRWFGWAWGIASAAFLFFGALGLVRVFSAYHYGVLSHHCPWCLMIGAHYFVGFPLYYALLVIASQTVSLLFCRRVAAHIPGFTDVVRRRRRRIGIHVAAALCVFGVLTAGWALAWRLRFGVWLLS